MEHNETYWELKDGKVDGYVVHAGSKTEASAVKHQSGLIPHFRVGSKVELMEVRYKDGHTGKRWIVLVDEMA